MAVDEAVEKFMFSEDYDLTTQLKSWISINPSYGCIWDCAYCIQEKDLFFSTRGKKVVNKFSVDDVVTEIMTNPRITSKSPLTFFNFSDPFLPHNTKALREILIELDDRRFTNIVGLISRTYADAKTQDVIAGLKNLRPVVLVSYAGYEDKRIEDAPTSKRVQLLKDFHEKGVKTILYLRPLVKEWIREGQFEEVRDKVGDYIDGVIMSGFRLTPEIAEKIKRKGLVVPKTKNYTNKYFPSEIQQKVLEVFNGVAPVFRYTSCGVSAVMGVPDYNAHSKFFEFTQKEHYETCPLPCTPEQKKICDSYTIPSDKEIRKVIDVINPDIKFHVKNGAIILDDNIKLSKEEITFIRHNTKAHVDYEDRDHHVDNVVGMKIKH